MNTRKILMFLSFFLLPVTLNYFSPVLIVQAGFENVFSVMHIVYILMLIVAMIFSSALVQPHMPLWSIAGCITREKY